MKLKTKTKHVIFYQKPHTSYLTPEKVPTSNYSPALNPIEEYFALLKYHYRKNKFLKKGSGFLPEYIYTASKEISNKEISGFALHCVESLKKCILKTIF